MADTNIILKYHRPQDRWLCPECDSENSLSYSTCTVCGCRMVGTPAIVKAWSEKDERPPAPVRRPSAVGPASGRTPVSAGGSSGRPSYVGYGTGSSKPVFVDPDRASGKPMYVEKESHAGRIILWTIAIILAAYLFVENGGSF